ncbi:MAG: oligosaccharide flippase family protein [Nitrospirota bacterium]|nr:oligosaccharide flippase family protein [Nitrospirota bacterium]
MQRRKILINAVMSIAQIIAVSAILFFLYRFLLTTLGIEQVGIWSLVIATASITQIASLGLSGSVVKFVAGYAARDDREKVSAVIQTAAISISASAALVLTIIYPVSRWLLGMVIPGESLHLALAVLPYSLLSLWLMMISSVLQAGLDGYQRIDIRSLLITGGAVLNLLLCFIMAPRYGLKGVAYATVLQNLAVLLGSWLLLKRHLGVLPVIPRKWNKGIFREIIRYGFNFQIISAANMLNDPITKFLLSRFGGLHMVGFYEMASKLIQQVRAVIGTANQVLVPAIAELQEKEPEKIRPVYLTSYQLFFYLSLPAYSILIVGAPVISKLWLGAHEDFFIITLTWVSIGWAFNTLAIPAYFANLGTGKLFWNVAANITIGILNICLGIILGALYNGPGVISAWVLALALGSSLIYIPYHVKNNIPLADLLPEASRPIVITCTAGILVAHIFSLKEWNYCPLTVNGIFTFLFGAIIFILLWIHPMRKRMAGWLVSDLLGKNTR